VTLHLIGRARLAQMKPGACLANVSPAEVVERAVLRRASAHGGSAADATSRAAV